MENRKVSIIIPAYNEEEGIKSTLIELMNELKQSSDQWEIVVIDDGSIDSTYENVVSIQHSGIKCLQQKHNKGYGAAIKAGIKEATGDIIVWYDADGQHRPEDLKGVVECLRVNAYDYVIGVRDERSFVDKNRRFGKKVLAFIANIMAKDKIPDVNSGLRAFKADVIRKYISMLPDRFGASTVTTFIMQEIDAWGGYYPIIVRQRTGKSTVKQFRDGFATLKLIMRIIIDFRPMQVFGTSGLVLTIIGLIYGVVVAIYEGLGVPTLSVIFILFGIQEIFFGIISLQIGRVRLEILENREF